MGTEQSVSPAKPKARAEVVGESLWADAWRRLRKNRLSMFGFVVTVFMSFVAIFAPLLSPFNPEVQQRWTGALPPGSQVLDLRNEMRFEQGVRPRELEVPERVHDVLGDDDPHALAFVVQRETISGLRVVADGDRIERLEVNLAAGGVEKPDRVTLGDGQFVRDQVTRERLDVTTLVAGGDVPAGLRRSGRYVLQLELVEWREEDGYAVDVRFSGDGTVASVARDGQDVGAAPFVVFPNDVVDVQLDGKTIRHRHLLGTDQEGRDSLSRLIYGGRISLLIGITATFVSLLVGVLYGATSGFLGGRIDGLMMRIVDVLFGLPYLFLVILMLVAFGRNIVNLFIALGLVQWLMMARIVRGQVLSLREKEFIDAARTTGTSQWRILTRHLIPNTMGVVVVYTTLTVPAVILQESFLAFLGLTVEYDGRPLESWGALVNYGREALGNNGEFWWLLLWPAIAMSLTLFSLNFLGDGLRDALDPQQRGRT